MKCKMMNALSLTLSIMDLWLPTLAAIDAI